jgi:type I restriction-modification system DNA methylase subunit
MSTDHRSVLSSIRRFDQLVAYLRDEMNWPIARDSFDDVDDLFFEFTPEELGLDKQNAAKIQEIKRLRPLSINQPWGIFFVKFEPKRLPVVALRRILSRVTVKKRASANSSERAAWSAADLLFISNYGEGETRQISFAHFSQKEGKLDLPTLKVLTWDNLDTPLHLDHVSDVLTDRLSWPSDESNEKSWREQWRSAFILEYRQVVNTSKMLSIELAKLARNIRDLINDALDIETKDGPVSKLMEAFKQALVHDLDNDGFADMYAQTIAYGLLSTRVANPSGETADDIAIAMPITNPFLKELMETFLNVGGRKGKAGKDEGLDFDELGISEIIRLLDNANIEAVIRDFGDKNPQEDPVIHFYELFLKEYDAQVRLQRGVFYTPRPVVSFIVRSVDKILKTEFGLSDGLADTTNWGEMTERYRGLKIPKGTQKNEPFVQILDPATGTGTFIVEVIDIIHETLTDKWEKEGFSDKKIRKLWNYYVPNYLLPRVHGYELMMAPYAIAHMKIGLKLFETGYLFESNERARVYLTNTLEPEQDFSGKLKFEIPALANESKSVNLTKKHQRYTVIIGNPPYSNMSANLANSARAIIQKFKYINGEQVRERNALQLERNLNDDYVKFIAWSEDRLLESGLGVISMISNNVYTWSPSLRGMRAHLLNTFPNIRILNLHGSAQRGPAELRAQNDENVFDIEQAVAIGTFCVTSDKDGRTFNYGEFIGNKSSKFQSLLKKESSQACTRNKIPVHPSYRFIPSDTNHDKYESFQSLEIICPLFAEGVKTGRDWLVLDFEPEPIIDRMAEIQSSEESNDVLCERIGLSRKKAWNFERARRSLQSANLNQFTTKIAYRPFDERFVFYHPQWIASPSAPVMRNLSKNQHSIKEVKHNLAILAGRISRNSKSRLYWCSRTLTDKGFLSSLDNVSVFPALIFPETKKDSLAFNDILPEVNLSPSFLLGLNKALGLKKPKKDIHELVTWTFDVFHYFYSIMWSPTYRKRYGNELSNGFPHIPLPKSIKLYNRLNKIGSELVYLHLMEKPSLNNHKRTCVGSGEFHVEKVTYSNETVWINYGKTQGFNDIPEKVWDFHIGGYQICQKWLKDRQPKKGKKPHPGFILTQNDINHYQKIVVALSETIRIMDEIDSVIDEHGGWPDAFK